MMPERRGVWLLSNTVQAAAVKGDEIHIRG